MKEALTACWIPPRLESSRRVSARPGSPFDGNAAYSEPGIPQLVLLSSGIEDAADPMHGNGST